MDFLSEDKLVTKDWLETILTAYCKKTGKCEGDNKDENVEVHEWNILPLGNEETSLSEILSLDVSYFASGQPGRVHLIAKLLPQDTLNRSFVLQTNFDLREIKFYTEVIPTLQEIEKKYLPEEEWATFAVPECFHSVYEKDCESILVLEDLRTKGMFVKNLSIGLNEEQAKIALAKLGQIQVASLVMQKKEKVDLRERFPYLFSAELAAESFQHLVDRGFPLFKKFVSGKSEYSDLKKCLSKYEGNSKVTEIFQTVLSPKTKLNTIVHTDFWCNNVSFSIDDKQTCCILDWQMLMYTNPTLDISMLIATSLPSETRRKYGPEILLTYWNNFISRLKLYGIKESELEYTFSEFERDFEKAKNMVALLLIGSIDLALGHPRREERVLNFLQDLMMEGNL